MPPNPKLWVVNEREDQSSYPELEGVDEDKDVLQRAVDLTHGDEEILLPA